MTAGAVYMYIEWVFMHYKFTSGTVCCGWHGVHSLAEAWSNTRLSDPVRVVLPQILSCGECGDSNMLYTTTGSCIYPHRLMYISPQAHIHTPTSSYSSTKA